MIAVIRGVVCLMAVHRPPSSHTRLAVCCLRLSVSASSPTARRGCVFLCSGASDSRRPHRGVESVGLALMRTHVRLTAMRQSRPTTETPQAQTPQHKRSVNIIRPLPCAYTYPTHPAQLPTFITSKTDTQIRQRRGKEIQIAQGRQRIDRKVTKNERRRRRTYGASG